jgi:tetratricopeptide (TPR) repeat protein
MDGLTILFALVAAAFAAAAVRQQRRSEGLRRALAEGDYAPLVQDYRNLLKRDLPASFEPKVRMVLSWLLCCMDDHDEALYELDQVAVDGLAVPDVASWLNGRAYVLAMLGRPNDALEHLADADDLMAGEAQSPRNASLGACILGTRGIALFKLGRLEEAEALLERALKIANQSRRHHLGEDAVGEQALAAERWWWLSEIARARGDGREAQLRLRRAASFSGTPFGLKARRTLLELPGN